MILLEEIQQRSAQLDSKATNILGWASATLAFVLLGSLKFEGQLKMVAMGTTACAALSVLMAFLGVRTLLWPSPSEDDWFKLELWNDPPRMKAYHVISMLTCHQAIIRTVRDKARFLRWSEYLLAGAAIGVTIELMARL